MSAQFSPDYDAASAYPALAAARAAMQARDWAGLRSVIDGVEWYGRSAIIHELMDEPWAEEFLHPVVAANPYDPMAATALGAALIGAGWRIRTTKRANDVSREQFAALHDYLRRAEQLLIDVTARDPANPVAWYHRLTTARGLQLGQAEARRRYDRCLKATPHFLPAQRSLLQQLCPKWGGSWEAAHDFARECLNQAPEGAHNGAVIVDAHMEHWEAGSYWQDPAVRREIREAAERTVLHPQFSMSWGWVAAQSAFAAALVKIEDYPAAAACFRKLGPYASESGWDYMSEPKATFLEQRAKALAAIGATA